MATTYNFTLRVTDANSRTSDLPSSITINEAPGDITAPTITSSDTISQIQGNSLAHSLTADEAVSWSITGGAQASAFEISDSTLRWAGNGVGSPGAYQAVVRATDAASNYSEQTVTATVIATLTISGDPPDATVGDVYYFAPTVGGGVGPYSFTLQAGSLSPDLSLNASTGEVTGTLVDSGVGSYSFTIRAADTSGQTADLPVSFSVTPEATLSGLIKWHDGSVWNSKPVKIWDGAAWALAPVKFWNGFDWVLTNGESDTQEPATADFYVMDGGTGDGLTPENPTTFATAWSALTSGQSIKLVGDTTLPAYHPFDKSVTILADRGVPDSDPLGDGLPFSSRFARLATLYLQSPNNNGHLTRVQSGARLTLRNIHVRTMLWPSAGGHWNDVGVATDAFYFHGNSSLAEIDLEGCEFSHGYGTEGFRAYDPTEKLPEFNSPNPFYHVGNGNISNVDNGTTAFTGWGDATWVPHNIPLHAPQITGGRWNYFRVKDCYAHDMSRGFGALFQPNGTMIFEDNWMERFLGDFQQISFENGGFDGIWRFRRNVMIDPIGNAYDNGNPHVDFSQVFGSTDNADANNPWLLYNLEASNCFFGISRRNTRAQAQTIFWQMSQDHHVTKKYKSVGTKIRNLVAIGGSYKGVLLSGSQDSYIRNSLLINPTWFAPVALVQASYVSFVRTVGTTTYSDSRALLTDSIYETSVLGTSVFLENNSDVGTQGATISHATVFSDPSDPGDILLKPHILFEKYKPTGVYATRGPQYATLRDLLSDDDFSDERPFLGFVNQTGLTNGTITESNMAVVHVGGTLTPGAGVSWRMLDRDKTTVLSDWSSSAGTVTDGKYVQIRATSPSASNSQEFTYTLGSQTFSWQLSSASVASFTPVDNAGTAWSKTSTGIPVRETNVRKLLFAMRLRTDVSTFATITRSSSGGFALTHSATGTKYGFVFPTSGNVFRTDLVPIIGQPMTHIIAMDYTKTTLDEVGKWVCNGVQVPHSSSTLDLTGTLVADTNVTFSSGIALFNSFLGNSQFLNGAIEMMYMTWGDANFVLPDILDPAVQSMFTADNIGVSGTGPTGSQPKVYYTGSASEWNDPAGLANKGTLTLPLIKQAGTYT